MAVEAETLARTRLCGDAAELRDGRAVLIGGVCKQCGNQTFPRPRQGWMEHKVYQHLLEE